MLRSSGSRSSSCPPRSERLTGSGSETGSSLLSRQRNARKRPKFPAPWLAKCASSPATHSPQSPATASRRAISGRGAGLAGADSLSSGVHSPSSSGAASWTISSSPPQPSPNSPCRTRSSRAACSCSAGSISSLRSAARLQGFSSSSTHPTRCERHTSGTRLSSPASHRRPAQSLPVRSATSSGPGPSKARASRRAVNSRAGPEPVTPRSRASPLTPSSVRRRDSEFKSCRG